MKKMLLFLAVLFFSITGYSQTGKWKKAQKINTIESYQEFIKKYPESEYSDDAMLKLVELEFKKIKKINTIESYQEFIKKYPEYEYSDDAMLKLIDLEFKKAAKINSIESYSYFLKNYEKYKNSYSDQAKNQVTQLEFEDAKKKNTVDAYEQFMKKYPDVGFYYDKARTSLAEIEFKNAKNINTIDGYKDFINKYPESILTSEAEYKLAEIDFKDYIKSNSLKDFKIFIEKYSGNDKVKLLVYDAIEDIMVNNILTNGVGNRFKITSIIPAKKELSGSIAIEPVGKESKLSRIKTVYPKDELVFVAHISGAEPAMPYGNKSIWRFVGENKFEDNSFFKGYTFTGDTVEYLTFIVLDKVGLVYLHGKGTVKENEKIIVSLDNKINNYKW